MLEQLDKTAAVLGGPMILGSKAFRRAVWSKLRRAYSDQFAGFLKLGQLGICCTGKNSSCKGWLEAT